MPRGGQNTHIKEASGTKKPPASKKPKDQIATSSRTDNLGHGDGPEVEPIDPTDKHLSLKKDWALLASILSQPMFDDDEILNLFNDLQECIERKLETGKRSPESYKENSRVAAAQTPLMKKFFSRCPKYRNIMMTQRPSTIDEDGRENGQVVPKSIDRSKVSKQKKKKKRPSFVIKSPWANQRVTRSRSRAIPTKLNLSAALSKCSTVNPNDTDESEIDASGTNKSVSTNSTTSDIMERQVQTKEKGHDSNLENVSQSSRTTKKRKPEFSEMENNNIWKLPQTFEFGQEQMRSAAKKRILDGPSDIRVDLQPVVRIERLSKKKIASLYNTNVPENIDPRHEDERGVEAVDSLLKKMELSKQKSVGSPLKSTINVTVSSESSRSSSAEVTSVKSKQRDAVELMNTLAEGKKSVGEKSINTKKSQQSNATFNVQPNSTPNTISVKPSTVDTTYNVPQPTSSSVTHPVFSSSTRTSSVKVLDIKSQKQSILSDSPETNKSTSPTQPPNATFNVPPSSTPGTTFTVPPSVQGNDATFIVPQPSSSTNNPVTSITRSSSATLLSMKSQQLPVLVNTPPSVNQKSEEKKRSTQLVRSASSNIELLQRKTDNAGSSKRKPSSSVKIADKNKVIQSPLVHVEKLSEEQKHAEKMKKMEERQDRVVRTKEEILQQKKALHQKQNEEWKAKVAKMKAEDERKKSEEERRKVEEAAKKNHERKLEERREAERKKKADEAVRRDAKLEKLKQEEPNKGKPTTSTFSVKAAVQALDMKTAAANVGHHGMPPPSNFLPKHVSGVTSSCPDIPKKFPAASTHALGKDVPGSMSKQISGSSCQLISPGSSWRPQGKNLNPGNMPPPLSNTTWKTKSPKVKTPVKSKPLPVVPTTQFPMDETMDESFVTVSNSTIDGRSRDTYDITIFDNIDEELKHRDGKYVPKWASDDDRLHSTLFYQQPNLIEFMQTKCHPINNMGYQMFPNNPS